MEKEEAILEVAGISKRFGGILALNRISLCLEKGCIVSMIGPNGAGKTTFVNAVTGIRPPDRGEINFQGEAISGLPAHCIASKGISRTFQLEELFGSLTVLENAMVGCHTRSHCGIFRCGFRLGAFRSEEKRMSEEAMEVLSILGLNQKACDSISTLSLGERKLVGVARALCMRPKLLLLDEPVGGLAAHEIRKFVTLIEGLAKDGLSIFIIEHNMGFVMSISEKVIVLNQGAKIAEGPPAEVKRNKVVIKAYIGEEVP